MPRRRKHEWARLAGWYGAVVLAALAGTAAYPALSPILAFGVLAAAIAGGTEAILAARRPRLDGGVLLNETNLGSRA